MQREMAEDVDELDIAQGRAEDAWSALREITGRMMRSPKVYRELAVRRDELEVELREALADIGAVVFDKLCEEPAASVAAEPEVAAANREQEAPAGDKQESELEEAEAPAADKQESEREEAEAPEQVSEPARPEPSSKNRARIIGRVEHDLTPSGGGAGRTEMISATDVASAAARIGPQFADEVPDEELLVTAEHLPDIKSRLGSPPDTIEGFPEFMGELGTLSSATHDDQLALWTKLPDEVQSCLVAYVAARSRHLQDEVPSAISGAAASDERMSGIFSRLSRFLRNEDPGFVHGMKRDHEPRGATWWADARAYGRELAGLADKYYGESEGGGGGADQFNPERALYEIKATLDGEWRRTELVAMVEEAIERGLAASDPRLVRLLRPYRDLFLASSNQRFYELLGAQDKPQEASEEAAGNEVLPDDWPWGPYMRAARTVMVGGDPRRDGRDRIIETFELSDFEWLATTDNKGVRQVQSLCERIERGSVDVVFLLTKYISHKLSNAVTDAVKGTDTHLVYLNDGYGVRHIQNAIEEWIPQEMAEPAVT